MKKDLTDIAPLIHQAILNPHVDLELLHQICDKSRELNFYGLCTSLSLLPKARKRFGGIGQTKLIAVIAFPFGNIPTEMKLKEAEWAAEQGAEELDVVPNFFALSQGEEEKYADELAQICQLGLPVRSIIDMNNLPLNNLSIAVEASIDSGVVGIQTSNGFGASVNKQQIKQLAEITRNRCSIKAVGGIKTKDNVEKLVEAGATYIGTTSGFEIMKSKHS